MNTQKIKGNLFLDDQFRSFHGMIKFERRRDNLVYASWQIFNEKGEEIASLSKEYFLEDKPPGDIFNYLIERMKKHRIGQHYIFKTIEKDLA